jgi:hypothetical protein
MKPSERRQFHARLADAMEAYADAAATAGVPIGELFDKEMRHHRSVAEGA